MSSPEQQVKSMADAKKHFIERQLVTKPTPGTATNCVATFY